MENCLICCSKNWYSKKTIEKKISNYKFFLIKNKKQLNIKFLKSINPKFIFFPHWNWKVPKDIFLKYNCILFHTSDLPKGRGGSPIQNLIIDNKKTSPVCAIQMIEEIDAGPEYGRKNISLDGNITEIFNRIQLAVDHLICIILKKKKKALPQKGKITYYKRREKSDSQIMPDENIIKIYNKIRCVDGLDYQKSFIDYGINRLEFSNAKKYKTHIKSEVTITKKKKYEEIKILKDLNKNKYNFFFYKMRNKKDLIKESYSLFVNRPQNYRISSCRELDFERHKFFVQNHPYRFWYLLKLKKSLKASIYFKFDNSVGINLISFNDNLLRNIICLILDVVKPLPKIDSIRPDFFTINLSIKNKLYKKTLDCIGLKKIQEVYALK